MWRRFCSLRARWSSSTASWTRGFTDSRWTPVLSGLSQRPAWSEGNWLFDLGQERPFAVRSARHDLDVIVSVFGKPDSVDYTACRRKDSEICDQYRMRYGYQNGMTVSAEAAWFNACIPFTARWRVYFEHGMVVCDDKGADRLRRGWAGDPIRRGRRDQGALRNQSAAERMVFLRELTHFVQCAERNVPSERVRREQVLDVLGVLETLSF